MVVKIVNQNVYNIIKYAFYGVEPKLTCDVQLVYDKLKLQGVASLMSDVLNTLELTKELKHDWTSHAVRQAYIYMFVVSEQEKLMNLMDDAKIPFVVLKGCAAAQYYPKPINRSMGDIDLLVKHEDFERACALFDKSGFRLLNEITPYERHARYEKNGIIYELHRFFASMNNVKAAEILDAVVVGGIDRRVICTTEGKSFPTLPDFENGFVLLQHVSQHLEYGLGLRQILDWMMYVHKYLDDDRWTEFSRIADEIGLKSLAVTLTRMCQIYLGLPEAITWCKEADDNLCGELMEYVMYYSDLKSHKSDNIANIVSKRMNLIEWFSFLQNNGKEHWSLAKNPIFKPFAWLYQLLRYAFKGATRKGAIADIRAGKKRRRMLGALGAKSNYKRLTVKQDGQFVLMKKSNK